VVVDQNFNIQFIMKNLVLIFFISVVFFNCRSDKSETTKTPSLPQSQRTEIGNFEYWHHIKNEGAKPLPGQIVFYSYNIRTAGGFVQGNFGSDPSGGILPTEEEAKSNPQAIGEALRRMAVGDSLTIIFPRGENPDSNYIYDVVLRSIHSR
jgi:hypothetical protein